MGHNELLIAERGEDIVPLIGAGRRDQLAEALGSLELELSAAEQARIEQAVPPDAERYGAPPRWLTSTANGPDRPGRIPTNSTLASPHGASETKAVL